MKLPKYINKAKNAFMYTVESSNMKLRHMSEYSSDLSEPISWQACNVPYNQLKRVEEMATLCTRYGRELPKSYQTENEKWDKWRGKEDPSRLTPVSIEHVLGTAPKRVLH